jgi:hypothetical protein
MRTPVVPAPWTVDTGGWKMEASPGKSKATQS